MVDSVPIDAGVSEKIKARPRGTAADSLRNGGTGGDALLAARRGLYKTG